MMTHPMYGPARAQSLIIVFRRKPRPTTYIRDYPVTAVNPTPAQIRIRIAFGEATRKAKGIKWKGKHPRPLASILVEKELRGKKFYPHKTRKPKWVRKLEQLYGAFNMLDKLYEIAVQR